ncbi:RidA family protein [candidate division WOR-3 bacterium]|nr:RidA family protein [candidate division WOR-3 bacterium]
MKKKIETGRAPSAIGPYSQGVWYNDLIFVSGQIPIVPETGEVIKGDVKRATEQVLMNIKNILESAGSGMDKVLMATIYLVDMDDFPIVNEVYSGFFAEPYPARATVGVNKLPKDVDIEISVIAHV